VSAFVINPYAIKPFSPANVSGLGLWLDATVGLFDATSGGNAVTTDGSAVARWEDQSGNNRHATQGTGSAQPLLKTAIRNGRNVIRFDGSNDGLSISSLSLGSSPAYTVFCVLYQNGTGFTVWLEGGVLNPYLSTGNGFDGAVHYDGSNIYNYTTSATYNSWNVFAYSQNSSNRRWYHNANAAAAGSASTRAATFTFIGSTRGIGFYFNGDIAELLIYSSYLSDADRESVRDYLNTKWAVY
jgi:hypothetical protein